MRPLAGAGSDREGSVAAERAPLVPIDQVADLLAERADTLARELLPLGHREGRNWIDASTRRGGLGDSMMVEISGPKRGRWKHFGANQGGDMIDLVAHVRFGGDKKAAFAWAKEYLGLAKADPAQLAAARQEAERQREVAAAAEARDQAESRRRAKALWLRGVPIVGTPVDAYLRGRGIDLRALRKPPSVLHYVEACHCTEAGLPLPAMVAIVQSPAAEFLTVHRTWLAPKAGTWASPLPPAAGSPDGARGAANGAGAWGKAQLRDAKKAYGPYLGGIIPLSRGASNRAWTDVRGDETVALAEGIETALSVAVLMPEWRVAATVALSNMGALAVPANWRRIVVCADRDRPDSRAAEALPKVLRHLAQSGAEVLVIEPDEGFKDWNDQLVAELAAAPPQPSEGVA